ncbi:Hypothetical predicted protein [Octopus vulgaris]|uniref:Uncharacterized protein n=1 Tax=Octopus vulgaris TaxID=6645 RepID=A0AA36F297_OCTVU|nr:Hypothetical predicted protein [Octopus vulgaris]
MTALSKEERIPDRMMNLSKEKSIELVLSEREEWSYRKIAEEFNLRHPYREGFPNLESKRGLYWDDALRTTSGCSSLGWRRMENVFTLLLS